MAMKKAAVSREARDARKKLHASIFDKVRDVDGKVAHIMERHKDDDTWTYVDDLKHVDMLLDDIIEFLGG